VVDDGLPFGLGSGPTSEAHSAESGLPLPEPTADDGVRLTGPLPWAEEARPTRPHRSGRRYSAQQRAAPEVLLSVHHHLRAELAEVRAVTEQVRLGAISVGVARSALNDLAIRQNTWTLGAYCQSYCRLVAHHHSLEDHSVFPRLRRSDPELGPVLDRLQLEHGVIGESLDGVDRALVDLVRASGGEDGHAHTVDALRHQVDRLTDVLLSHLAYEEREILHPLAEHGFY
jgi:hypothetical protein